jgi:uncharacterized protein
MKSLSRRIALAASLVATVALAADEPFTIDRATVRTFQSQINGVGYKLYISVPESYASSNQHYPVVYLLDPDYSFLIARNITDHLAQRNHLRELILVAIGYQGSLQYQLNRTRDYTPKFSPDGGYGPETQKVSGGGPKFRDVISKEIVPMIDGAFRTIPGDRCIVGHSYGGLFAAWNLATNPGMFSKYIIVSPSLWYADRMLMNDVRKLRGPLNARVYIGVGSLEGNGDQDMTGDMKKFAAALRQTKFSGVELKSAVLDDETHNSVFPRALSNGLRFVFNGR